MGKREIQSLEDGLGSLAVALPDDDGTDSLHFHAERYPGILWRYERARSDVAALGMSELVESTIRDCLTLVGERKRKEAQDLLFATCRALSEKSGTWDDMRRMYTASNEPTIR